MNTRFTDIERGQSGSYDRNPALTMAIGILAERISKLPQADRDDLYELVKELAQVTSKEEYTAVTEAMYEILDQDDMTASPFDLTEDDEAPPDLKKWMEYIAGKIKEVRTSSGITQVEVAKRCGIPQSHISRLEAAKHSPSSKTIKKIAEALQVRPHDLDPSID